MSYLKRLSSIIFLGGMLFSFSAYSSDETGSSASTVTAPTQTYTGATVPFMANPGANLPSTDNLNVPQTYNGSTSFMGTPDASLPSTDNLNVPTYNPSSNGTGGNYIQSGPQAGLGGTLDSPTVLDGDCTTANAKMSSVCSGESGTSLGEVADQVAVGALTGVSSLALSVCGTQGNQGGSLGKNLQGVANKCQAAVASCVKTWVAARTAQSVYKTNLQKQGMVSGSMITDIENNMASENTKSTECSATYQMVSSSLTSTLSATGASVAGSAVCQNLLAANTGACNTSAASTNPACTSNYCQVSASQPMCASYNSQCTGANASAASGSGCQSLANMIAGLDKSGNLADSGLGDETNPGYGGYAASQNKAAGFEASGAGGNGGGGLGGGAPGGGAGTAGAGAGGGAAGFKTDIGGGVGGGGGGFSVGSVPLGGGGGGGYGRNNDELARYLPGGAMDPSRKPASDDLASKGITGANDLSNFQKISRLMSKKRTVLKPGEGS